MRDTITNTINSATIEVKRTTQNNLKRIILEDDINSEDDN